MDGRELEEAVLVPPKKADEIYKDVNQRLRGFELSCVSVCTMSMGMGIHYSLYTSESVVVLVKSVVWWLRTNQAIPTQSLQMLGDSRLPNIKRVHGLLLWYVLPHFWFSLQFRTAVGWSLLSHVMLKAFIWFQCSSSSSLFYFLLEWKQVKSK